MLLRCIQHCSGDPKPIATFAQKSIFVHVTHKQGQPGPISRRSRSHAGTGGGGAVGGGAGAEGKKAVPDDEKKRSVVQEKISAALSEDGPV